MGAINIYDVYADVCLGKRATAPAAALAAALGSHPAGAAARLGLHAAASGKGGKGVGGEYDPCIDDEVRRRATLCRVPRRRCCRAAGGSAACRAAGSFPSPAIGGGRRARLGSASLAHAPVAALPAPQPAAPRRPQVQVYLNLPEVQVGGWGSGGPARLLRRVAVGP
jgi:hypothetical protein